VSQKEKNDPPPSPLTYWANNRVKAYSFWLFTFNFIHSWQQFELSMEIKINDSTPNPFALT
jgi:hypothetical protein